MQKLLEVVRFRVTSKTYKELEALATEDRRTLSDFVRILVEEALEKRNGKKRAS